MKFFIESLILIRRDMNVPRATQLNGLTKLNKEVKNVY